MQRVGFIVRSGSKMLTFALLLAMSLTVHANEGDVPNTAASINKGRSLFMTMCTACHGSNGKAQVDVIADATDLTEPALYRNGSADAAIFKSIQQGAGTGMPPFGTVLSDADIKHLSSFIKNLWPPAQRPPVGK